MRRNRDAEGKIVREAAGGLIRTTSRRPPHFVGQKQKWFLLQLTAGEDAVCFDQTDKPDDVGLRLAQRQGAHQPGHDTRATHVAQASYY